MAHAQALRAAASGTWALTGTLATARTYHTATLLPDGDVLVAGGMDDSGAFLASAELYHPQTGSWSPTGAMSISRTFHTATLLPTGQVLVAGGLTIVNGQETVVASAELYTPATGSWSPTGAMSTSREFHTATLLQNGQVLVAGEPAMMRAAEHCAAPRCITQTRGSGARPARWARNGTRSWPLCLQRGRCSSRAAMTRLGIASSQPRSTRRPQGRGPPQDP